MVITSPVGKETGTGRVKHQEKHNQKENQDADRVKTVQVLLDLPGPAAGESQHHGGARLQVPDEGAGGAQGDPQPEPRLSAGEAGRAGGHRGLPGQPGGRLPDRAGEPHH